MHTMNFEPTLVIFLFAYLGFIAIFFVFSIIHIYHIFLSASFTFVSFIASFIIFVATIFTIYGTGYTLRNVDWQQPLFDQRIGESVPSVPFDF